MLQAADSEDPSMKIYDLSQTIHRCPSSSICPIKGVMQGPTVLPGSFFGVSFPDPGAGVDSKHNTHRNLQEERLLLPEEKMMMLGWPVSKAKCPVDLKKHRTILNHLSGNMFASTVFGSVFASFMAAVPWQSSEEGDQASDEAVEAALAVAMG